MIRRLVLLLAAIALPAAAGLAAAAAAPLDLLTAADCSAGVTPAQTEGPYFKAGSPAVTTLAGTGIRGTKITLVGWVLGPGCRPIANAVLDVWQADDEGRYDNSGYTLRGHVSTDAKGRYVVETILPGIYPGRTRHIHVKVEAPGRAVLTSQLYFPEDTARNRADGIYDARLLVRWLGAAQPSLGAAQPSLGAAQPSLGAAQPSLDTPANRTARFDFVLP